MTTGTDHLTNLIGKTVYVYRKPYTVTTVFRLINKDGYACLTESGEAIFLTEFQVDKAIEDKVI